MIKNNNRDNFSPKVRTELAKRVAYRCSNPDCGRVTVGPKGSNDGSVITGIACHIFAAAPKGPRANNDISSDERSSIDNGMWLCSNCSALIDKDPDSYPPDLLLKWKQDAEQKARYHLEDNSPQSYHQEEKRKSINYSVIDDAIAKVIFDQKLIDFLNNHDFTQPYYRPLLNNLFDLIDIIQEHSNEGSPYDNLLTAIVNFRMCLARNAFWYNPDGYFKLGQDRNPEEPHQLAIIVANSLRMI